jgi:radical SAM protein with 4Fe4S-binding SPASM domain
MGGSNRVIPFFPLKVRKNEGYRIFNPVDSSDYEMNYPGYRILEMCDGMHSPEEIAEILAGESVGSNLNILEEVNLFLSSAYESSLITSKKERFSLVKGYPPPLNVFWDITGKCNLCCLHCCHTEHEEREEDLPYEETCRIADEIAAFGVKNIIISGGEPFARQDFMKILTYISSRGFDSVNVCTNGTLVTPSIARDLSLMHVNVQVSLDGDTAGLHDRIRGKPGTFEKTLRGIRYLVAAKVPVTICSMLLSLNADRILQIRTLVHELGVESFRVQRLIQVGRGKIHGSTLMLQPDEMKEITKRLIQEHISVTSFTLTLEPPSGIPADSCGSAACSAGTTSCSITSDGTVIPCAYFWGFKGYNVRDHSFGWIWEHSPVLQYFRTIQIRDINGVCRQCQWLSQCNGGCKAENYASGDLFNSSPACWVAAELERERVGREAG